MKPPAGKLLITGSSGMLGIDISRELSENYELYGVDMVHSPWSIVHSFKKGDVTDEKSIATIFKEVNPEIVIHTAAITDVDGCEGDKEKAYRVNARGAGNVAAACKKTDAVMVHISTDFVFDGKKLSPYTEDDKVGPLGVYGDSKLKGEEAVKKSLFRYFILRTGWLYGKNGKNFVDTILRKARGEKELKVVDDQIGSPTYTRDLAKAISALLARIFSQYPISNTQYGIYHVSNSGSVSWYKYAKEIVALAGSDTKIVPISSEELARPAKRPAMSVLDNSRFGKFTGFVMRPWKEALKEYISKERR